MNLKSLDSASRAALPQEQERVLHVCTSSEQSRFDPFPVPAANQQFAAAVCVHGMDIRRDVAGLCLDRVSDCSKAISRNCSICVLVVCLLSAGSFSHAPEFRLRFTAVLIKVVFRLQRAERLSVACGKAEIRGPGFSWLFSTRRQAQMLLAHQTVDFLTPNV